MKKNVVLLIAILLTMITYGQRKYIVNAENGLFLRKEPNSKGEKIGKLNFGTEITIIEKTEHYQTIADNGREISGNWVKIAFQNFPTFVSNEKYGYVFDAYLKNKNESINEIVMEISKFSKFENLTLNTDVNPHYFKGDFFGDETSDLVFLLRNEEGETKIGFIDYGEKTETYLLGDKNDPFNITDYGWVGIFRKVDKREALWSNYEDDFIDFKDVPEHKKVRLNYNSIYLHASESCGGGFVYWKDGKFNWLQQE